MATEKGWIKLSRAIQEHWIFSDAEKFKAWIDLIMLANHEDKKVMHRGHLVVCKRGTVNRSIKDLSNRWEWHWRTTKRFLEELEKDGMITLECQRERTVITLVNYGVYQDDKTNSAKRNANQNANQNDKRNANHSANQSENPVPNEVPINKNVKNYKNDKECKECKEEPPADSVPEYMNWTEDDYPTLEEIRADLIARGVISE